MIVPLILLINRLPPHTARGSAFYSGAGGQRLFVFANESPLAPPEKQGLVGVALPGGQPVPLLRSAQDRQTVRKATGISVSPQGGSVACTMPVQGRTALWIVDVRRGVLQRIATLGEGACRLSWTDEETLRVVWVQDMSLRVYHLGAAGWRIVPIPPKVDPYQARLATLRRIRDRLDDREFGFGHEALSFSSDGRSVAVQVSKFGGAMEDPGPVIPGDVSREFVSYDRRTLRRTFAGPSAEQANDDPPRYAFAGWVGSDMAILGPYRAESASELTLYGPKGKRTYPLPGAVGRVWSLAGGAGLPTDAP